MEYIQCPICLGPIALTSSNEKTMIGHCKCGTITVYLEDGKRLVECKTSFYPRLIVQVNLWECLTHMESCDKRSDQKRQRITNAIGHFSNSSRWNMQEISLASTENGWVIEIFSCKDQDHKQSDDDNAIIFIPKYAEQPVKILKPIISRFKRSLFSKFSLLISMNMKFIFK